MSFLKIIIETPQGMLAPYYNEKSWLILIEGNGFSGNIQCKFSDRLKVMEPNSNE